MTYSCLPKSNLNSSAPSPFLLSARPPLINHPVSSNGHRFHYLSHHRNRLHPSDYSVHRSAIRRAYKPILPTQICSFFSAVTSSPCTLRRTLRLAPCPVHLAIPRSSFRLSMRQSTRPSKATSLRSFGLLEIGLTTCSLINLQLLGPRTCSRSSCLCSAVASVMRTLAFKH
jgi:hypothetical protein